jgi:hypothetical protein
MGHNAIEVLKEAADTCDEMLHDRSPLRRALSEHFSRYSGVLAARTLPLLHPSVADVIDEQELLARDSESGAQA